MSENPTDTLAVLRETIPERLVTFAETYLSNGLDAAAAAHACGAPGQQRTLLTDRRTLSYLAAMTGQIRAANADVRTQIVGLLAQMALFDPAGAVRAGSLQLRSMEEMPANVRMCIEGWEVKADGSFKVKFVRRLDVIRLLLEMTGDVGPVAHGNASGVRVVFEKVRTSVKL